MINNNILALPELNFNLDGAAATSSKSDFDFVEGK